MQVCISHKFSFELSILKVIALNFFPRITKTFVYTHLCTKSYMAKRLSSQTTHWLVLSQSPNQSRDMNFTLVCNFDKFHIFHLIGPI